MNAIQFFMEFFWFVLALLIGGSSLISTWNFICVTADIFWEKAPSLVKITSLDLERRAFLRCAEVGENLGSRSAIFSRLGVWGAALFVWYFLAPTWAFFGLLYVYLVSEVAFVLALRRYKVEWID